MQIDALLVVANNLGRWRVYIVHKMEIIYRKKEHAIKSYQDSIKTEDFGGIYGNKEARPMHYCF
jgi:hypothetical protein